jgi:hypothetical protein
MAFREHRERGEQHEVQQQERVAAKELAPRQAAKLIKKRRHAGRVVGQPPEVREGKPR